MAAAYTVEAVRIFDHYEFRVRQANAKTATTSLQLEKPPASGNDAWWTPYYAQPAKIRDRQLFAATTQ